LKISNILFFSVKDFVTRLHVLWRIFCTVLYLCTCRDIQDYIGHVYNTCFPLLQFPRQSAHNQTTQLHTYRTG